MQVGSSYLCRCCNSHEHFFLYFYFYSQIPTISPPPLVSSGISSKQQTEWDDRVVSVFSEPSLASTDGVDESYRLILLPTFDHPASIRVTKEGEKLEVVLKLLDGKGGYGWGTLSLEEKRNISTDEWQKLTGVVEKAEFWSSPFVDPTEPLVNDGASWHVEGSKGNVYHRTTRVWPRDEQLELCKFFLKLAGRESEYEGYW
jgi:hypothetical protein